MVEDGINKNNYNGGAVALQLVALLLLLVLSDLLRDSASQEEYLVLLQVLTSYLLL